MEYDLLCHAQTPMPAIESVRVQVERQQGRRLALNYTVTGDIATIAMPLIMAQERADELWRTTCFEAFLRLEGLDRYFELNFSPSTRWAAYYFSSYRAGRTDSVRPSLSRIDIRVSPSSLALDVVVDLARMAPESLDQAWQAGLSAVIDARDGAKSYWALAHPPGEPDFHHRDCFATILEAPATE